MGYRTLILVTGLIFAQTAFGQPSSPDTVEVESTGTYSMAEGGSKELARQVALFEARRKAATLGAKYLSGKGLVDLFEAKKPEILCLAAGQIETNVLEEKWTASKGRLECVIRIHALIREADFIRAETDNRLREKEDQTERFSERMEPKILREYNPGLEIAKAYRLLRTQQWRAAIIYLDRLELKYPDWADLPMVKAMGYHAMGEPLEMKRSLERACGLGSQEACLDLKSLKKAHGVNLTP
jgi:tetratricopeptide (TPR) repeat protein